MSRQPAYSANDPDEQIASYDYFGNDSNATGSSGHQSLPTRHFESPYHSTPARQVNMRQDSSRNTDDDDPSWTLVPYTQPHDSPQSHLSERLAAENVEWNHSPASSRLPEVQYVDQQHHGIPRNPSEVGLVDRFPSFSPSGLFQRSEVQNSQELFGNARNVTVISSHINVQAPNLGYDLHNHRGTLDTPRRDSSHNPRAIVTRRPGSPYPTTRSDRRTIHVTELGPIRTKRITRDRPEEEVEPRPALLEIQHPQGAFQNAQNTSFNNSQVQIGDRIHHYRGRSGIEILSEMISTAAMHDSSARYPPPRCYPETRDKAITSILTFVQGLGEDAGDKPVGWMHAPFGHGKSAVMQTAIEKLIRLGLVDHVAGGFFFGRDDPQRNQAHLLLPTIAYQIARNVPGMEEHISAAVADDPTLPSKSIENQLVPLLVVPFSRWSRPPDLTPTIFIDGLDECGIPQAQRSVLKMIEDAVVTYRLPLRFVVASRPEAHLSDSFRLTSLSYVTRIFELDDNYAEMQKYLQDEFVRIRCNPCYQHLGIPEDWPSDDVICNLVERASGQYLFAETIIRFVDDEYEDPRDQLQIILTPHSPHQHSPFSFMDTLYHQILSNVPIHHRKNLQRVLSALVALGGCSMAALNALLNLETKMIYVILRRLRAVISIYMTYLDLPDGISPESLSKFVSPTITVYHVSFKELLVDRSRGGDFTVNKEATLEELTRRYDYLLSSCFFDISINLHPLLFDLIEVFADRQSRGCRTPFGTVFPQFNHQYQIFVDIHCAQGTSHCSMAQFYGGLGILLEKIVMYLSWDDPGRNVCQRVISNGLQQLVDKSPYSPKLFQMLVSLSFDLHQGISMAACCRPEQQIPAEVVLNVLNDFAPLFDFPIPGPVCVVNTREGMRDILIDESMPGHRCYVAYREAYLHRMSDWYHWFLDSRNLDMPTLNPECDPSNNNSHYGFLKLKLYDGNTSAFLSLVETMCLPQLSHKLALHVSDASFTYYSEECVPLFFIPLEFLIMNYQEACKLKHNISTKLYNYIATLIKPNMDFLLSDLYIPFPVLMDPVEMSEFLFQEPWLSLMSTQNHGIALSHILWRYRGISKRGRDDADDTERLKSVVLSFVDRLLQDPLAFARGVHDDAHPGLYRNAHTERIRSLRQLRDLVSVTKRWREDRIPANLQRHKALRKAIDDLIEYNRPFSQELSDLELEGKQFERKSATSS